MSEQLSFTQSLRKNAFIENKSNAETNDNNLDFDPDEKIENLEKRTFEEEMDKAEAEEAAKETEETVEDKAVEESVDVVEEDSEVEEESVDEVEEDSEVEDEAVEESEDNIEDDSEEEAVEEPVDEVEDVIEAEDESVEDTIDESIDDLDYDADDVKVVFIGNKPVMNYVLSIVTLLNNDINKVSIKARGRAINRAVDVAEVVRHRFITKTRIVDIKTATEEVFREDGSSSNVSTIEILLSL